MPYWKDKLKKIGMKNIFLILLAGGLFLLASAGDLFSAKEEKGSSENFGGLSGETAGGVGKSGNESSQKTDAFENAKETPNAVREWEEKLKEMLSGAKGVGKVDVMITLSDAGEKVVLKDAKSSAASLKEADGAGGSRTDQKTEKEESTVCGTGSIPYVTKELSAQVAGVLVICEGGGNADVVLQIVSVAEALFGISAHRIVVLEMK